ncbi:MAG: hypothetical protein Q4Q06_05570 [Bacteroidota bacterium]|nr:hypothetical protein [Bacteroidota bacterium]
MKAISLKHRWQTVTGSCLLIACLCSCNSQLDLREAFNKVSEIEHFEIEEYQSDIYGFPVNFGDATVCVHPNSSCCNKVLDVLSEIPKDWLALEMTADDQIERFYVAPDSKSDNLLFVHIGKRSGDTVLILFTDADITEVEKFISKINEHSKNE